MISEAQKKQLDYSDLMIKSLKSLKQKYKIEEEEFKKVLARREQVSEEARIRTSKQPKRIHLNHLPREKWQLIGSILESEMTEELFDKEMEYFNY